MLTASEQILFELCKKNTRGGSQINKLINISINILKLQLAWHESNPSWPPAQSCSFSNIFLQNKIWKGRKIFLNIHSIHNFKIILLIWLHGAYLLILVRLPFIIILNWKVFLTKTRNNNLQGSKNYCKYPCETFDRILQYVVFPKIITQGWVRGV